MARAVPLRRKLIFIVGHCTRNIALHLLREILLSKLIHALVFDLHALLIETGLCKLLRGLFSHLLLLDHLLKVLRKHYAQIFLRMAHVRRDHVVERRIISAP